MNIVFHAHSVIRHLTLFVGVVALAIFLYRLTTGRTSLARSLMTAFTALVDVQVLLGIVLVFARPFYGELMGHITMMVPAAVTANGAWVMAGRSDDDRRALVIRTVGIAATLLLIVFGILAIGRSIV